MKANHASVASSAWSAVTPPRPALALVGAGERERERLEDIVPVVGIVSGYVQGRLAKLLTKLNNVKSHDEHESRRAK